MAANVAFYDKRSGLDFWQPNQKLSWLELRAKSVVSNDLPEVLFITSFPPRECGIATYSKDLIDALESQFDNSFTCSVCALESSAEKHLYNVEPKFILNTDKRNAFIKTAFAISRDPKIKLVVVQHEFGFFAKNENEFTRFIAQIAQPVVFVFHTVLPNPNKHQKAKIKNLASHSRSVIVMTENSASIFINQYEIPAHKISVIPHGTHLVPPPNKIQLKEKYGLEDKTILSTFGLLGSSKSIETTLHALPTIIALYPNVLFLVMGKTHPSLFKQEGERYRESLELTVNKLRLTNHVKFINEYLELPVLLEYLQLTDIYLFTSNDPYQAVSGTFSYAVSSGCPVVSTPIPHAKEVLSNGNGILIDFGNSEQLSTAVVSLLADVNKMYELSSNSLHKMASTAWQNSAIKHAILFKNITSDEHNLKYNLPEINLAHVQKLTTNFGMIQFSKIAIPDLLSGYTLDDNARALLALCQHYEMFQLKNDLKLISIYLHFIQFCLQKDGTFLNYVNVKKEFVSQNENENLDDSNGRAIWALGYLISLKKILPSELIDIAKNLLIEILPNIKRIHSTRAMAFIIKGLYYENNTHNLPLINILATRIINMYEHEKTDQWFWFENYLTYGNSILPEAMLCAYLATGKNKFKLIAIESFDFLLNNIFKRGEIKVVSNKGWLIKDKNVEEQIGGEQPVDVAYTIMALEKFYTTFRNEDYKQKAIIAFNWFLGKNHLKQIVYNPRTGGCYDGIEEYTVNLNQGAESTLSYLLARLTIQRIKANEN